MYLGVWWFNLNANIAILYIQTEHWKYKCVIVQVTKSAQFQPQNVPKIV